MARNAETGVSRSALTDFTTGTSVAERASRENSLKLGLTMRKMRPTCYRASRFIIGETPIKTRNSREILRCEPIRQLTRAAHHRKIPRIESREAAFVRSRAYADQVLGRARFHANATSREHALWRQYLLRRSALR